MIDAIANLFGIILRYIYSLVSENYGLTIIIFTIFTNIIIAPITYKQAKAMEKTKKIAPLEKEIREKYKGNKEKQAEELSKMYSEHKINPLGGCLPLLIQIPIIFAMLYIVRQPLTYIIKMPQETIIQYANEITQGDKEITEKQAKSMEIQIAKEKNIINMNFLGLNLGDTPYSSIKAEGKKVKISLLVPLLSVIFAIWQTKQSTKKSALTDEQKEQQKSMNLMMPLLSGYISLIMPLALGVYWLLGSIIKIIIQYIIDLIIDKQKILLKQGE